jgi:hypothetical protein
LDTVNVQQIHYQAGRSQAGPSPHFPWSPTGARHGPYYSGCENWPLSWLQLHVMNLSAALTCGNDVVYITVLNMYISLLAKAARTGANSRPGVVLSFMVGRPLANRCFPRLPPLRCSGIFLGGSIVVFHLCPHGLIFIHMYTSSSSHRIPSTSRIHDHEDFGFLLCAELKRVPYTVRCSLPYAIFPVNLTQLVQPCFRSFVMWPSHILAIMLM